MYDNGSSMVSYANDAAGLALNGVTLGQGGYQGHADNFVNKTGAALTGLGHDIGTLNEATHHALGGRWGNALNTAGSVLGNSPEEVAANAVTMVVTAGFGRLTKGLFRAAAVEESAAVKAANAEATAAKTTGWGEQDGSPHVANVTVRGPDGKIVHQGRSTSGSMTPTEKEMGFPQGQNASHTEAKAVMDPSIPSGDGHTMTITGGKPPCNSCKGYMSTHAEATGTKVRYQWRQNGKTNSWKTGE